MSVEVLVTLLSSVTMLFVGVIAWTFVSFRTETKRNLEQIWNEVAPLSRDVAVIKAIQSERHEFLKTLRTELIAHLPKLPD